MNHFIVEGNLVDEVELKYTSDNKSYCYGKIGCYNGKDKDGEPRDSMFVKFTAFGKDAELLSEKAVKGSRILISGTLNREDTKDEDGRKYVNLKVTCNSARILVKADKKETTDANDGWGE